MFQMREPQSSTATPRLRQRRVCPRANEALCLTLTLAAVLPLHSQATSQTVASLTATYSTPPGLARDTAPPIPAVGPLSFRRGFPVTINDNGPFLFHLNPGAPSAFYLSSAMAQELGLDVVTHGRFRLMDETSPSSGRYVDLVRIGQLRLGSTELHDLRGVSTPQGDSSVLGIGAFRGLLLTLDFPNDRLTISHDHLSNPDNLTVFHFVGDETTPVVPITLNGTPTTAHVEASAEDQDGDIMVPIDVGKRLPLLTPLHEDGFYADGIGRTWIRFKSTLKGDVQIGAITLHNPTLIVSNRLSYINLAGVCRRLLLRFDLDDRLVEIKLPTAVITGTPQTAVAR